jgi:lysozyme
MKVSAAGRKAIAGHEGVRLKAYPDPATGGEPWTIGVGHTSAAGPPTVTKGMTITAEECDEILSRDLAMFERAVEGAVKVPLNQNQFDALVSFTFNVGAGNLQKSTLLRKLNARDYRGAADQFAVWNKAAGKVMAGLTKRRADERALFLKVPVAAPPAPSLEAPPEPTRNDGTYTTPPGFWSRFWSSLTKRILA